MGMAASQARLLSITARLTDNENSGQSVSYSKQRLADQTQQITNEYNEALNATKLTVLTGFNGAQANYTDISYNLMTGLQMAENMKQYVVTDTKGRILVEKNIADAYKTSKGNYNLFLASLGYSQADIGVQKTYTTSEDENGEIIYPGKTEQHTATEQKIHDAWDKYFQTVGKSLGDDEHDFGFSWTETINDPKVDQKTADSTEKNKEKYYSIGDGYAGYFAGYKTNSEGVYVDANDKPLEYTYKYNINEQGILIDKQGNPLQYRKDSNGNPIDQYGNILYKTNKSGNYIDKDGNEIPYQMKYALSNGSYVDFDNDDKTGYKPETLEKLKGETSNHLVLVYTVDDLKKRVPDYSNLTAYDAIEINTKATRYKDYDKEELKRAVSIYNPIIYEGTSQESRDLYDYAMSLTEAYLRTGTDKNGIEYRKPYDLTQYKSAANADNNSALKYYKNIFNKIQSSGYFTYTNSAADVKADSEHYIYADTGTGTAGNVQKSPLYDNVTFEAALRDGSLRLEYFSTADKKFKATTLSDDNCIQEVADERAIARAESKYTQDMADLENKDNKLDLQLKKLDTEHNALQTEYDSVKSVIDKNVESSFKIFS